jgi:hypothetical protein
VALYGVAGIDLRKAAARETNQPIEVALSSGKNNIEVSALNARGVESLKQHIEVEYAGPSDPPQLYALVIGVSKYSDARYDLNYAAKDARDLAQALIQHGATPDHVLTLTDADATQKGVLAARSFLEQAKVDDNVLIFSAGHGLLDDKLDYYLATSDASFENPSAAALPYAALEGLLDGLKARKKVLLIDACNSGEVDKEDVVASAAPAGSEGGNIKSRGFKVLRPSSLGLQNSFELLRELFADLRRGTGAMVVASASGTELAFESSEWSNGVFTFAVLETLRQVPQGSHVKIAELRESVIKRVQALTGGRQTPTSRRENAAWDFDLF